MPVPLLLCLLVTLFAAHPAELPAQAPRITPAGDPSARNDTLYRLAVDAAAHPDEQIVLLLDDGVVRYESDGTGTKTYRQITQILSAEAVEDYAEHEFSYAPGHQRLTVNWIRVVRPDGTVVSETPTQAQDADVPATLGDPVSTDTKVRRLSLTGVAPGTIVDWSYTIEERKPFVRGDFTTSWSVHTGRFTRRSRYIRDLPETLAPRLQERNLSFARQETVARARRVLTWATQDVPRITGEEFMADSNGVFMSIEAAGPTSWDAIGRWVCGARRGSIRGRPRRARGRDATPHRRADRGRHAPRGPTLGGAGRPVRLDRARARRLPAALAGRGGGDRVRRLQGQGDALRRGRGEPRLPGVPRAAQQRWPGRPGAPVHWPVRPRHRRRRAANGAPVPRPHRRSGSLWRAPVERSGPVRARGASGWDFGAGRAARGRPGGKCPRDPDHGHTQR